MLKGCNVDNLKMSDYGIKKEEMSWLAQHAMDTMGRLFNMDRYKLSPDEAAKIMENAFH